MWNCNIILVFFPESSPNKHSWIILSPFYLGILLFWLILYCNPSASKHMCVCIWKSCGDTFPVMRTMRTVAYVIRSFWVSLWSLLWWTDLKKILWKSQIDSKNDKQSKSNTFKAWLKCWPPYYFGILSRLLIRLRLSNQFWALSTKSFLTYLLIPCLPSARKHLPGAGQSNCSFSTEIISSVITEEDMD